MTVRAMRQLALTPGDWALIVGLAAISLASIFLTGRLVSQGAAAVVEVDGEMVCRLDLSIDSQRVVVGPLGKTVLQVCDGRVRVIESPCPHGICISTGWVARTDDIIVCVPNRVVVRVEGGEAEAGVDATTW